MYHMKPMLPYPYKAGNKAFLSILVLLSLLLISPSLTAQVVSVENGRFQKGDDPAWNAYAYDDSAWRSVTLPHGTGKTVRVLVLCTPDKEEEAKAAGADYYGLDEYITKIKGGWTDVDVIITMPSVMPKVGALGRILGPRGLMPNPKTGTVTMEVGKAVQEAKAGKIDFKVDKYGIIHTAVAKVSFDSNKIVDNAREVLQAIIKLKPAAAKGTYVKSICISSTMSAGVKVDTKAATV